MSTRVKSRARAIVEHVRGSRILDVGCAAHVPNPGSPYWLHAHLRKAFPYVMGIDVNAANIARLQEMGLDNLLVATAMDFELHQEFDTIVAGELIEHLPNPGMFLKCARKHLAREGRVVITTPYPFSLLHTTYAFLKFPKTCSNDEHTAWFCPRTITKLANRCGYEVAILELIEDYELDNESRAYLAFAHLVGAFGRLIPKRLRCNTILAVLVPEAPSLGP